MRLGVTASTAARWAARRLEPQIVRRATGAIPSGLLLPRRLPSLAGLATRAGDADKYKQAPNSVGAFKSPIVEALWSRRSTAREMQGEVCSPPIERKPSESRHSITYKFSTDEFLRTSYENPWGFFRKGKLFEDLDALAGTISFQHCERDGKVPLLVTASVDRIRLAYNPKLDVDMEMSGQVVWTGTSSCVINMEVRAVTESHPWVTAAFTFVARSPQTGKATAINRLAPETPADKALFEEIEQKNRRRKAKRKAAEAAAASVGGGKEGGGGKSNRVGRNVNKEAMVQLLLTQARPHLEMPCLADPTCVLIDRTRLSNSTTMQPQQRNQLSRIFGGFLMRRAYELAFSTAYLFSGARPSFFEVAHVDFLSPVDVGDLMRFDSAVLYTRVGDAGVPLVHVEVVASICRPESVESRHSNTFHFTFEIPDRPTVKKVLPANLDQAQRMVERIEAIRESSRDG